MDGPHVPPGKSYTILTMWLLVKRWLSTKRSVKSNHPYSLGGLLGWLYLKYFGCHDLLFLGKSHIKCRQCPDMTIAVDWDVKYQFKQTNFR